MSPNSPYYRAGVASHAAGTATTLAPTAPVRGPATMLGLTAGASGETVSVEHGVFTSIRSHTGEGYRIITATPGIKTDERAEITRRCPSHGSFCEDSADAVGMSFSTLATERHFVAIHCHAGVEHTARGGQRVYTHFVVLDNAQFSRFGLDAGRVALAIARAIGDNLVLKVPPRLDPLNLVVPAGGENCTDPSILATARNLSRCLLNACDQAISTPAESLQTYCAASKMTPAFFRARAACTIGLKFSPSRPAKLVIAHKDGGEFARSLRGQEHAFVDLSATAPSASQYLTPWFDFVDRRMKAGRARELFALNDELTTHCSSDVLKRLAEICDALDHADQLSAEALETARARFAQPLSQHPAEAKRLMALHVALDRRATALSKADKAAKP